MTSSSGNSSGNSGSLGDLQVLMNERKRKRMQSNRESARRSRMRKQQHLDELMAQATQLKKENVQISNKINITSQHYMNMEAENSVLRAQMMELSQRLESLNEILSYMNNSAPPPTAASTPAFDCFDEFQNQTLMNMNMNGNMNMNMNNPWMLMNQQPIMASADFCFQY